MGPTKDDDVPKYPHDFNGSHVVGEDVEVAEDFGGMLLPASLEALAEDKHAEREDKKAACHDNTEDGITARG